MKLLELHINGFGKIHDRTISFSDGINVIYGRNEAGKVHASYLYPGNALWNGTGPWARCQK